MARGADVDVWMAAVTGDLGRVRELIDRDPSLVNRVNDYNSYYAGCGSPLKNAAGAGHMEIVQLLLDRGADPNLPEEGIAPRGHALYAAVYHGHYDIARLLLEHGAYPNPPVESSADALWIAIRRGDSRMIELLASYGATWEIPNQLDGALTYDDIVATGLLRSVEVLGYYGDVATAAPLFASDPAVANDADALAGAAGNGHEEFVRLLLRYQPDLPKHVTITRPRAMAELLFAQGMDPNRPNWMRITPLHQFADHGDIESAALFIRHGADVNARDDEHCSTPLGWAARSGQKRMVDFLLRSGAKPRLPDDPAWATPVAWAQRRGHEDIVRLLTVYERSGALPERRLEQYEAQASDLVEAYRSGDDDALQHVMDYFRARRPLTRDRPPLDVRIARLRRLVHERLAVVTDATQETDTLPLSDARLLIARAEGFASWSELVHAARA
jgi:hypothetical protein